MNMTQSIWLFKCQSKEKFTVTYWELEWAAADYMVLATILVACVVWLWLAKNLEKMEKYCNLFKAIVWLFIGMSFILLITNNALQQELHQNYQRFLELPAHDKVGFIMVIGLILVAYYIFKMVKNWIITTYSITMYYMLVMGVRAVLLWYAVDPHIFLSVEVGSILLALVWVFCKRKPDPILEWGKQLVELVKVVFYMQLTLLIARLLAVVYSHPTPSVWVCTTILVLLFEAALCLGKVLVEMPAADGFLWGDFSGAIQQIRRLVSPDYAPAFLGGRNGLTNNRPKKRYQIPLG